MFFSFPEGAPVSGGACHGASSGKRQPVKNHSEKTRKHQKNIP